MREGRQLRAASREACLPLWWAGLYSQGERLGNHVKHTLRVILAVREAAGYLYTNPISLDEGSSQRCKSLSTSAVPCALRQWASETWGEPLGIAAAGSPLACTMGSKVPSKGRGLGTDEFCPVTELAVNTSALRARFSLSLSCPLLPAHFSTNFLMPHAFEATALPPSTNKYLLHTRSENL